METKTEIVKVRGKLAQGGKNPARVYLAGLYGGKGRSSMESLIEGLALLVGGTRDIDTIPWHGLRAEHVAAIRARLQEQGKAPATVNLNIAALRGIAKAAWTLEQMNGEHYQRIRAVPVVRGSREPRGRSIRAGDLRALFATAEKDSTPAGARDTAILALAYAAGLRRSELADLDLGNLEPTEGAFTLHVIGKGNKERTLRIDDGALNAVNNWLAVRGTAPGPLFYAGWKGGALRGPQRMTDQAVRNVIVRRAARAKIGAVSPHDLRRSFVSDLLDGGVDIATVSKLAGHADPKTTARYDRRGDEAKAKALRILHVPVQRKEVSGQA